MLINVDFDGALVPNIIEDTLMIKQKEEGWSWDWSSQLYDWYCKYVEKHPLLPLDVNLLTKLSQLRKQGHSLRLWTNRNYILRDTTFKNLGVWKSLFESFSFNDGRKSQTQIEGMVIDNDPRYFSCAEKGGILYQYGSYVILDL
jgi:hypothetical protein